MRQLERCFNRSHWVDAAIDCGYHDQPTSSAISGTSPANRPLLYRRFGFEAYGTEPNALKVGSTYIDEEHMILRIREPD